MGSFATENPDLMKEKSNQVNYLRRLYLALTVQFAVALTATLLAHAYRNSTFVSFVFDEIDQQGKILIVIIALLIFGAQVLGMIYNKMLSKIVPFNLIFYTVYTALFALFWALLLVGPLKTHTVRIIFVLLFALPLSQYLYTLTVTKTMQQYGVGMSLLAAHVIALHATSFFAEVPLLRVTLVECACIAFSLYAMEYAQASCASAIKKNLDASVESCLVPLRLVLWLRTIVYKSDQQEES